MFKDGLKTAVILFLMVCFAAYLTNVFYNYWVDVDDIGVTMPDETLYPFKEGHRWGYINAKGEIVVSPVFAGALPFDGKYVEVRIPTIWSDWSTELFSGRTAYLGRDGKIYESEEQTNLWKEELNLTKDRESKKYGYKDRMGEWVIPAKYDSARPFCEGLAAVSIVKDEWRFIDKEGDYIPNLSYGYVDVFSEGLAWAQSKGNYKWGAINARGEYIVLPIFKHKPEPFSDNVSCVLVKQRNWVDREASDNFGIYDINEKRIIAEGFQKIDNFSQRRAIVYQEGKVGFVNTLGEWVVNPLYDSAKRFSGGLAAVCKNGKWGYIGLNGEVVIPFRYQRADSFYGDLARVNEIYVEPKIIDFDYIDKQGNYVNRKMS